jgi:dolichyl-phosphate-mannose--protein O-mannosyl transferase
MVRPIYLYVDSDDPQQKIYSLGNPILFWLTIPALLFVGWQALRLRTRLNDETGKVSVRGALAYSQWPFIFIALSFLGVWLPWATQPRVLFVYHYLPALTFAILALGYSISRLWHADREWGRWAAVATLALIGMAFLYFYPHLTAMDVPQALEESYYWFSTWR